MFKCGEFIHNNRQLDSVDQKRLLPFTRMAVRICVGGQVVRTVILKSMLPEKNKFTNCDNQ